MEDYRNLYGAGRPVAPPLPPAGVLVSETGEPNLPPTLTQYKKHASRFGAGEIYETAKDHVSLKELIELVHALRALPPTGTARFSAGKVWSLDKSQREELTERMVRAGYKDKAINRVVKGQ